MRAVAIAMVHDRSGTREKVEVERGLHLQRVQAPPRQAFHGCAGTKTCRAVDATASVGCKVETPNVLFFFDDAARSRRDYA